MHTFVLQVRYRVCFATFTLAGLFLLPSCGGGEALPEPGSEAYQEAVTAFYSSIASIQAGSDVGAEENLVRVTELAPGEPAGWANLGLLALRQNRYDEAREWLLRAHELAPDNSQIVTLLALLESNQGNFEEAVAYLRQAVELDPGNLQASYALAQAIERQGGPTAERDVRQLIDRMLQEQPDNLVLLLEKVRLAARQGDRAAVEEAMQRLAERAADWPPEVQEQFQELQQAVSGADLTQAATRVAFLRNTLLRVPAFRRDLVAVQTPAGQVGELITRFIRLPATGPNPAPPDMALTFEAEPVDAADGGAWFWAGAVWPSGDQGPTVALAGESVRIGDEALPELPGRIIDPEAPAYGVAPIDLDYDYLTDIVLAGPGGVRVYFQAEEGEYVDVTPRTGLPAPVLTARYTGAWPADVDSEGDIDVVLGSAEGAALVLRNNGDGTFTPIRPFEDVDGVRDFAWADLDADGDPDAALLDASGTLHVRINERMGQFRERAVPASSGPAAALAAADVNSDGLMDLVVLGADGTLRRLSAEDGGTGWATDEIGVWEGAAAPGQQVRLFVADLDNNGGLDLIASGAATRVWLRAPDGSFQPLDAEIPAAVFDVADLNEDGRVDLVGLAEGRPVRLLNEGTRDYHWQVLLPRAALAVGDQRVNSFGIGGEIELRAGLLFQKQPIKDPAVHFGLGEHEEADVARIIWPNGDVQAEFDLSANQTVGTPQRLKGSCPWLFTYDGEGMQFVTDFLWRSPLGLRINAQETAGVAMTEDRIKILGDQLVPRDGFYDVRITAELWETHFFDHVSLLVLDHPEGTEMFIDERFVFPPPSLDAHITSPVQPVAGAWDDTGRDVSATVRERDGRYLDTFGPGQYQGITRDHHVEVEIPAGAPQQGLRLIGYGWVRPTDSSINVAISQGSHPPPSGLRLEVPDGEGGWTVVEPNLGFPAGKSKTVVIDLDGVFEPGTPRRLRLRTNLEIYWDALGWATAQPQAEVRTEHLTPHTAELRYRGFSHLTIPDRSSPEVPDYQRLWGTAPHWRDLVGYYTRFGDVRELLMEVDDRYVIANAGDEVRLLFEAPPPPPEGWTRDFVLIGDGWNKDGDYNTGFSKTVLPLPSHDDPVYSTPPGALEDDPVYRRYPQDWQTYHTRYVGPEAFHYALRPDEPNE